MIFKKIRAFTLSELIMVVIIVGILVSIAIPTFYRSVAISRAREARSALGLIQAGQKIYYSRIKSYLSSTVIATINSSLGLNLEESYWDYSANNAPPNNVGTAIKGTCTYTVSETGTITGTGGCPE